jgi:hypothetical protein
MTSPSHHYNRLTGERSTLRPHEHIEFTEDRPDITSDDLDTGAITRYFVCRTVDESELIEVNSHIFHLLKKNPLYKAVEIPWVIKGPATVRLDPRLPSVIESNTLAIEYGCRVIRSLKFKLRNLLEYYHDEESLRRDA